METRIACFEAFSDGKDRWNCGRVKGHKGKHSTIVMGQDGKVREVIEVSLAHSRTLKGGVSRSPSHSVKNLALRLSENQRKPTLRGRARLIDR